MNASLLARALDKSKSEDEASRRETAGALAGKSAGAAPWRHLRWVILGAAAVALIAGGWLGRDALLQLGTDVVSTQVAGVPQHVPTPESGLTGPSAAGLTQPGSDGQPKTATAESRVDQTGRSDAQVVTMSSLAAQATVADASRSATVTPAAADRSEKTADACATGNATAKARSTSGASAAPPAGSRATDRSGQAPPAGAMGASQPAPRPAAMTLAVRQTDVLAEARAAETRGDLADAAARYAEAARLLPNDAGVLAAWAGVLARKGDGAEAARLYERVLALDPRNADALSALAVLRMSADPLAWRARLAAAIERYPRHAGLRLALASVLAHEKDWLAAAAHFGQAAALDPRPETLYNRAVSLDRAGQWSAAARAYREALSADANGVLDRAAIEKRLSEIGEVFAER